MLKKIILLAVTLIAFSSKAFATYTCHGEVKGVTIEPKTGALFVTNIGPLTWQRLCMVHTEYNGVSPETCRAIYSMLLTAQTAKKDVTLWFNDGKDCSLESHPAWTPLSGWYFGPMLED